MTHLEKENAQRLFMYMPGAPTVCKELHLNASISVTWPTVSSLLFSSQLPHLKTLSPVTKARTKSLYFSYGQSRSAIWLKCICSKRTIFIDTKLVDSSQNTVKFFKHVIDTSPRLFRNLLLCNRMKWTFLLFLPNYTQDRRNIRYIHDWFKS
jgi:hypothetical protein